MVVSTVKPTLLRTIAAIILGAMIGSILFFIVALVIGAINDAMKMNIPFNLRFAENVYAVIMLVVFVGLSIAGMYWLVLTTPPTEEETESPGSDD